MWWQDRDEDVLPVHGVQESPAGMDTCRQLRGKSHKDKHHCMEPGVRLNMGLVPKVKVKVTVLTVLSLLQQTRMRRSNSMPA